MPAEAGGGRSSGSGVQEPGGASHHRLLGFLSRSGKTEFPERLERKCIVAWRDAALMASSADPGALIINRPPGKSSRIGDARYPFLFRPFRRLLRVTRTRHCDFAPRPFPDRRCRSSARQPSDAGPNGPETHLLDETFGGEECARGKTASQRRIHVAKQRAILSHAGFAARALENRRCDIGVSRAEHQAFESS